MKTQNIHQIAEYYNEIQVIDTKLNEIHHFIEIIATEPTDIKITIDVKHLDKLVEKVADTNQGYQFLLGYSYNVDQPIHQHSTYHETFPAPLTIYIFKFVYDELVKTKNHIINLLKELGVEYSDKTQQ